MSKIMIRTLSDFADSHASWQKEQIFIFVKGDLDASRGIPCACFFFKAKGMFKPGFFFDIPMFFCNFAVRKLQRVITKRKQNGKD